jgi:CubicO group peptidase (beta-lactamase class C family)
MKTSAITLKALFLLLFLPALHLQAQQPSFVTDSLEIYIPREMKNWNLPGLAITVVKDGKVVLSKGYGVQEMGTENKVNEETLFQIASCSKAFTATSLALLAHQKKISLDDTVRRWMPGFHLQDPLADKQVTLRDLLCHRIGMQTFQGDFVFWGSNFSRKEIIGLMAKEKPVYGFRSQYGYCNAAFLAAGEIIPLVTGQSWDDFLATNFFLPLHMTRTSTTHAAILADKNACKAHSEWGGKLQVVPYDNIDNMGPAGSLNSCVKDLSHWLLMQLDSGRFEGKEVIPFAVLQETRKPQMIIPGTPGLFPGMHFQTYGLGWQMADFYGKKVIWHNGGTSGFLTTVCFVPELNLGFSILTNSDANSMYNALRYQLLDAYLGLPYRNYSSIYLKNSQKGKVEGAKEIAGWEEKVKAKPVLPVEAKAFAGTYINELYGKMIVTVQDGKIGASFEHHPTMFAKLEYMGDNTFRCSFNSPLWGISAAPFVLKDGIISAITISVSDNVDRMKYTFVKKGL